MLSQARIISLICRFVAGFIFIFPYNMEKTIILCKHQEMATQCGCWVATGRLFVYFIFPTTFKNNNQPVHILSAGIAIYFILFFIFPCNMQK